MALAASPGASTEPRSFERGNRLNTRSAGQKNFCFNGAAFFRTRKPGSRPSTTTWSVRLQRSRVLSNAETRSDRLRRARVRWLQRSRVLSNAETLPAAPQLKATRSLQRSRVLSNAETMRPDGPNDAVAVRLQRSRVLSNAETPVSPFPLIMVPKVLQRSRVLSNAETPLKPIETPHSGSLQRSRVLSNAETSRETVARNQMSSFNGAAFFRTRKRIRAKGKCIRGGKLQRSRVLSNAETPERSRRPRVQIQASTEPRSFERGNSLAARKSFPRRRRFNGAAFFRTRKLPRRE